MLTNKTILIISPESWGEIFISKHHYAVELVKRRNKVYFLNPPSFKYTNKFVIEATDLDENLLIINNSVLIRGLNFFPYLFRKLFQKYLAKKLLDEIESKIDIVWSFDPFRFQYMHAFQPKFCIYHAVDIHNCDVERDIACCADLILGSSEKILERFNDVNVPKFKINHGLSENFIMNNVTSKRQFIRKPERVNVGYVGNLHYQYLDVPVLEKIILDNPNVDFYFIGPYEESNVSSKALNEMFVLFLESSKNAFLMGVMSSQDLAKCISQFDLFLMCYTGDKNVAEMANPHKILEFFSTGKVVVSHYIDEYKEKKDLLVMADDNDLLPFMFRNTIENLEKFNTEEMSHMRMSYAFENTYSNHIKRIDDLIINIVD